MSVAVQTYHSSPESGFDESMSVATVYGTTLCGVECRDRPDPSRDERAYRGCPTGSSIRRLLRPFPRGAPDRRGQERRCGSGTSCIVPPRDEARRDGTLHGTHRWKRAAGAGTRGTAEVAKLMRLTDAREVGGRGSGLFGSRGSRVRISPSRLNAITLQWREPHALVSDFGQL